jgi:hypothetical protein
MDEATRQAIEHANAKLAANNEMAVALHDRAAAVASSVEQIRDAALALLTKRRQRKRKPSFAGVVKQAARSGVVSRVEVDPETGKIIAVLGKPDMTTTVDIARKIDVSEWN